MGAINTGNATLGSLIIPEFGSTVFPVNIENTALDMVITGISTSLEPDGKLPIDIQEQTLPELNVAPLDIIIAGVNTTLEPDGLIPIDIQKQTLDVVQVALPADMVDVNNCLNVNI